MPIGAELVDEGARFRVWAPAASTVDVVFFTADDVPLGRPERLTADAHGYFDGAVAAAAGARYRFKLDNGSSYPDPASRFQPDGPFGSSELVDPSVFSWTDEGWPGFVHPAPILYEMHVGTFTEEGTWAAAARELPALAALGVTAIEVMPIAEFPGRFGWGYDGVLPFAPTRLYGRPDDLRAFVDRAHALGLAVILDVVYNHFGPAGNCLARFSNSYFTANDTEWGRSINFDGPDSTPVRELVVENAAYWIREFHMDGLRLDATQSIADRSRPHVLTEIARAARGAGGPRRVWIVGENEPQHAELLRREADDGCELDALWNDDFHHSAMVALTGRREAYYTDYQGHPSELIAAAKFGFLYQGQMYSWQKNPRGTPTRDIPARAFVGFLQNHDQVANSRSGQRVHQIASAAAHRAMTALLLLGPWTPMLFQGQEFNASAPFLYFADHDPALSAIVARGRWEFLRQFPSLGGGAPEDFTDPGAIDTFLSCKLDKDERARHVQAVALHASLIRLRQSTPAFRDGDDFAVDGATFSENAFFLRFSERRARPSDPAAADRLLLINLGGDTRLEILPNPLLSPYPAPDWTLVWSSEDPAYGGGGITAVVRRNGWMLQAESAVVLQPLEQP